MSNRLTDFYNHYSDYYYEELEVMHEINSEIWLQNMIEDRMYAFSKTDIQFILFQNII